MRKQKRFVYYSDVKYYIDRISGAKIYLNMAKKWNAVLGDVMLFEDEKFLTVKKLLENKYPDK